MSEGPNKSLGQTLVERELITEKQLSDALNYQQQLKEKGHTKRLGEILVRMELVDQRLIESIVARQKQKAVQEISSNDQLHRQFGEITVYEVNPDTGESLVNAQCRDHIMVCLAGNKKPMVLATQYARKNMLNYVKATTRTVGELFDWNKSALEHVRQPVLVSPGLISIIRAGERGTNESGGGFTETETAFKRVIMDAYEKGATDVHFYRWEKICQIKYRIRGSNQLQREENATQADAMIATGFQSLGEGGENLAWDQNIKQRRRIPVQYDENISLDLRYEHAPGDTNTYHAAVRILDNDDRLINQAVPLEKLGFTRQQARVMRGAISKASGMTIIAGPTNSGKSTTMAQLVKWVNHRSEGNSNILTVEAPIERRLPAFQTSVSDNDDSAAANEYAEAIKSTLRRDPDFLMIGEIRDPNSASAVVSGVQSGHPILTTTHAQSAIEIVERMAGPGMQVPAQTLGSPSFISALCYQMLLPCLNDETKIQITKGNIREYLESDLVLRILEVVPDIDEANLCIRNPTPENPDGYSGQTICAEVIMPDEVMLAHFRRLEITEARQHWRRQGEDRHHTRKNLDEQMVGLSAQDHAIAKMIRGEIDPRDVESYFGFLTMQKILADGVIEESEAHQLFSDDDSSDGMEDTGESFVQGEVAGVEAHSW